MPTAQGPRDPIRAFRIPDAEWQAAIQTAKARNESLSAVIRAALRRYVARHKGGEQ